jgi:peptidoglycan/LPS O-acetylase OafA/YrhL
MPIPTELFVPKMAQRLENSAASSPSGTPRQGYLSSVELGRGIAALLVVLTHSQGFIESDKYFAGQAFGGYFAFGRAGVDFFFVLSGFIILHAHYEDIGRRSHLRSYLVRRFTRIYPTYWLACLIFYVSYKLGNSDVLLKYDAADLLRAVALLPGYPPPYVQVAWTLVYEMTFYLAFGALILFARFGVAAMACWFIVLGGMALLRPGQVPLWMLDPISLEFALGMLVAIMIRERRLPGVARAAALAVLGSCAFFFVGYTELVMGGRTGIHACGYALCTALLLYGLAGLEAQRQISVPWVGRWLGAGSYSIYLFHYLVLAVVAKLAVALRLAQSLPAWAWLFILTVAAALVGGVVHSFVERPLLSKLREWIASRDMMQARLSPK